MRNNKRGGPDETLKRQLLLLQEQVVDGEHEVADVFQHSLEALGLVLPDQLVHVQYFVQLVVVVECYLLSRLHQLRVSQVKVSLPA